MLTLVESLSLAGDRAKQNDDAFGFADASAWVIDGATDLHETPLTGQASDAAWLAHALNARLHADPSEPDLRARVRAASSAARGDYVRLADVAPEERWKHPIASLLICAEHDDQIAGLHLGDCRAFALGADNTPMEGGPAPAHAEAEAKLASAQKDPHKPLLERAEAIAVLRRIRAQANRPGAPWTFSLDPACADHAALWAFKLHRPAHLLLATDGFAALADRYSAYDGASLVRAALKKGLQELGRELRAVEAADETRTRYPRFKTSDDATALLLRLS